MYAQEGPAEWAPLIKRIAAGQDLSGSYRDRCVYQSKISVTRFKNKKDDWKEEIVARRETTAETAPNEKREVITRVIADTDDRGRPRKVEGGERNLLGMASFLDAIYFPFYPEKISKYEYGGAERYEENGQAAVSIVFVPKRGVADAPLIEGKGYFLEKTGEILKLEIQSLSNFEILDKSLRQLTSFKAVVEYQTLKEGLRAPVRASGQGSGKLKQLEGNFRFTYTESGHTLSSFFAKD